MAETLRHHLRRETGAVHEEVEAAFARYDLAERDGLERTLRAHLSALSRLMPSLEKTPALHREVSRLLDLARASYCAVCPEPFQARHHDNTRLHPLAVGYVILGSRLGSRVIAARLKRAGLTEDDPSIAYFTDDKSRQHWAELQGALSSAHGQADEIMADTNATFRIFLEEALGEREPVQVLN